MKSTDDFGILGVLNGKHLKISGNQFPPYVYSAIKNGVEVFEGSNYEIIRSASVKYNFTFELDAPKGKATGTKLKNGTWTGLFADVFYQKTDIAVVLAHTSDRNGLIDFTTSFGSADLIFSTAHPKVAFKPEAIVYSFSLTVWMLLFSTIFLLVPVVYFSIRQYDRKKMSVIRSCTMIYKICLEQSTSIPHGLEFLAGMQLLFIIILGTGYKCNLLTALSFPEPDTIPTTFSELVEQAQYKIYFDMSGVVGYNYFMKGQSPMIVNLRERFKSNLVRNNPAKCVLSSFLEPTTVCIAWHTVLNQVIGKNLTMDYGLNPIFRTQAAVTQTWVTIGLQKNSPYTSAFSFITSSYYETGLITKWHDNIVNKFEISGKDWMRGQEGTATYMALLHILRSKTKGATPLELKNVKIIFMVIIVGLTFALGLFCGELINYYLHVQSLTLKNPTRKKPWQIYVSQLWNRSQEGVIGGTSMGIIDSETEQLQIQVAKERIDAEFPTLFNHNNEYSNVDSYNNNYSSDLKY